MASIKPRGPRQWRVQIRRQGNKSIYRTFESYADAKRFAEETEGRISGDVYVDRSGARATKLRDLLTRYKEEITPAKKGAVQEEYRLNQWLAEEMADWSILAVQPADIATWRRDQEAAGKAPSTINNALNLLSSVFRAAISEWGLPISNPCQGVRRVAGRAAREAHLKPDQELALLEKCADGPAWLPVLVTLAIETGMRQGELLALTWDDIYGDHAFLRDTKNGTARRVPLSLRARTTLKEWKTASEAAPPASTSVFSITRSAVAIAFRAAVAAAQENGCPQLTFHDLRHVAATRLAKSLTHLELARVLGHKGLSMTLRYYNPSAGELAEKIDGSGTSVSLGVIEKFQEVVEEMLRFGIDPRTVLEVILKKCCVEGSR